MNMLQMPRIMNAIAHIPTTQDVDLVSWLEDHPDPRTDSYPYPKGFDVLEVLGDRVDSLGDIGDLVVS